MEEAECMAMIWAMQSVWTFGYRKVIFKCVQFRFYKSKCPDALAKESLTNASEFNFFDNCPQFLILMYHTDIVNNN